MTPGIAVLAGALALGLIGGTAWRATNGRMRRPRVARPRRAGAGSSVPLSARVLQEAGVQAHDGPSRPADSGLLGASGPANRHDERETTTNPGVVGRPDHGPVDAQADAGAEAAASSLTSAQLGHVLGERATLVQFSSAFCAPCRATRRILADVAGMTTGVANIEIDAESRLDLVRQLNVLRTPTVLVLDAEGRIVRRASGQPRKPDVIAAIGVAINERVTP